MPAIIVLAIVLTLAWNLVLLLRRDSAPRVRVLAWMAQLIVLTLLVLLLFDARSGMERDAINAVIDHATALTSASRSGDVEAVFQEVQLRMRDERIGGYASLAALAEGLRQRRLALDESEAGAGEVEELSRPESQ